MTISIHHPKPAIGWDDTLSGRAVIQKLIREQATPAVLELEELVVAYPYTPHEALGRGLHRLRLPALRRLELVGVSISPYSLLAFLRAHQGLEEVRLAGLRFDEAEDDALAQCVVRRLTRFDRPRYVREGETRADVVRRTLELLAAREPTIRRLRGWRRTPKQIAMAREKRKAEGLD